MKIEALTCPNCGQALPNDYSPSQQFECESCGSTLVATDLAEQDTVPCPKCRTLNSANKRFCSSCGQSLKIDCILCHTENTVGTVHCINCGVHLEQARARRDRIQADRRRHRLEQEQILKEKIERQKEEKLQRLLDDLDEPENHDMAIYQINQMGVEAIIALTDTLLNDEDPDARYGSARALGQICSEHEVKGLIKAKAAKGLIQALDDPEPAVRYWSSDALGKFKSQTAVEPLAVLLDDPHEGVRNRAREALQQIGGNKVDEILAEPDKSKGILGWFKGD